MDRAGTNDDEEPVAILTVEDPTDCFPCFHNQRGDIVGDRKFRLDGPRGGQRLDFYDVLVVERSIHGGLSVVEVWQHSEMFKKSLHDPL